MKYTTRPRGAEAERLKLRTANQWKLLVTASKSAAAFEEGRAAGIPSSTFRHTCYGTRWNPQSAEIIEKHFQELLKLSKHE